MVHIIGDDKLGDMRLLKIEGEKPHGYTHYKIGGKVYKPIIVHDMPGYIAIKSDRSHLGEAVEFLTINDER